MMGRKVWAVLGVLLAGPAVAEDYPAYVGKWGEMADKTCKEPLLLTDTTMAVIGDDSWQCEFPASGPGGRSWTMKMKCATEGEDWKQTQTWNLTGETLGAQRLTIKGPKGTYVYRRCNLSKRGAPRRS